MQLPRATAVFNRKQVETILRRENKYITELFDLLPLPTVAPEQDDVLLEDSENTETKRFPALPNKAKASRAKSLVELQKRLDEISRRKKLSYKEKLVKKNLKTRIKRKGKQGERSAALKQDRLKKEINNTVNEIKNEELKEQSGSSDLPTDEKEKVVFSKFDFSNIGKKKFKKEKYDPKKQLEKLQKERETVEKLAKSGELEKAVEIKEKAAWKNALAKAQGEKVKDDIGLLSKSIKKREQKVKQSKKKWEARKDAVDKAKMERQQKRQDNIDKRKKEKKNNKMKKAVKKGKVIPGF